MVPSFQSAWCQVSPPQAGLSPASAFAGWRVWSADSDGSISAVAVPDYRFRPQAGRMAASVRCIRARGATPFRQSQSDRVGGFDPGRAGRSVRSADTSSQSDLPALAAMRGDYMVSEERPAADPAENVVLGGGGPNWGTALIIRTPAEKTWVWSDLHLGHAAAVENFGRPFEDVEAMNRHLLGEWRRCVQPDHTIICLGDVADEPRRCRGASSTTPGTTYIFPAASGGQRATGQGSGSRSRSLGSDVPLRAVAGAHGGEVPAAADTGSRASSHRSAPVRTSASRPDSPKCPSRRRWPPSSIKSISPSTRRTTS